METRKVKIQEVNLYLYSVDEITRVTEFLYLFFIEGFKKSVFFFN